MKTAAIYARVSSDKQREENTIASQTAALVAFAGEQQFEVPREWIFEDDGYSGASLIRPGLERVRDLAAEGLIQALLVYAPDRLSRRYAHQILLIEELARAGVETVFIRAPRGSTPEDELLVQFQGMIAEYERAQILERSRRGKRHRARLGEVSVLSGAPFGYRFIRKTDHSAAYYEINEDQARVVRQIFELYSVQGLSIGAIARLMNEQAVPTCKRRGRWERSTVWGMLRNPAYKGEACFGKTTIAPRQRITRPVRMRGGVATRNSASHERAREDWITIAVPPIVSEETFALAQERLQANKIHAPRRTVTPSVVQGLVSCTKCGYALYRTSTRSSARKIHYYRCLGSDTYRHLSGPVCNNRLFDRIFLTMWFGQRLCGCSKILALSRMSSSGDSWRLARLIRQNVATRRSGVIWSVSAKASIVYSPLIRKVFSRSKNCASACRSCDDANRQAMPNCRRLPIAQSPAQPTCASLRR
jgi:site-specific DNA recombinase